MSDTSNELTVTRFIDATPATVWRTITERLPEWWCPKPWQTQVDNLEWRAGGAFETTMSGPDGESVVNRGVFLEVTPNRRMVFTDAVDADWNPQQPFMIGIIAIESENNGTRYTASARHWHREAMEQHENMGFREGWQAVAEQLATLAEAAE